MPGANQGMGQAPGVACAPLSPYEACALLSPWTSVLHSGGTAVSCNSKWPITKLSGVQSTDWPCSSGEKEGKAPLLLLEGFESH